MSIGASLRTFILEDSTISGLVGTDVWAKSQEQIPTLPSIIYTFDYKIDQYSTTGNTGLAAIGVVFACWADDITAARLLADHLRRRIDGYSGVMGTDFVQGIFHDDQEDKYDKNLKKDYVLDDYRIWYNEIQAGEFELLTESGELLLAQSGEQFLVTQ